MSPNIFNQHTFIEHFTELKHKVKEKQWMQPLGTCITLVNPVQAFYFVFFFATTKSVLSLKWFCTNPLTMICRGSIIFVHKALCLCIKVLAEIDLNEQLEKSKYSIKNATRSLVLSLGPNNVKLMKFSQLWIKSP